MKKCNVMFHKMKLYLVVDLGVVADLEGVESERTLRRLDLEVVPKVSLALLAGDPADEGGHDLGLGFRN